MSIKKQHLYDMAWHKLNALCAYRGRAVTAGEFAIEMGIARSTAKRWLQEMVAERGAAAWTDVHTNGQSKTVYTPDLFSKYAPSDEVETIRDLSWIGQGE